MMKATSWYNQIKMDGCMDGQWWQAEISFDVVDDDTFIFFQEDFFFVEKIESIFNDI